MDHRSPWVGWLCALLLVLGLGCAPYHQPVVFLPTEKPTVQRFFSNGQPIAIVQADSCSMLLSVEPTTVAGHDYLRVWWLYANLSHAPVLVEPLQNVSVVIQDAKGGVSQRTPPEAPSRILNRIKNEQAVASIALAVGGALKAAAASVDAEQPVTTSGPGGTYEVRDPQRSREATAAEEDKTAEAIEETRLAYQLYAKSVNDGVLRRNTVLPGAGVNGYVYVPLLLMHGASGVDSQGNNVSWLEALRAEETQDVVVIRVGAYSDSVLFTPGMGE